MLDHESISLTIILSEYKKTMITKEIKKMSKSEKLILVQDLWDDISGGISVTNVLNDEVSYVDDRIQEINKTNEQLIPWDSVKAKARKVRNLK